MQRVQPESPSETKLIPNFCSAQALLALSFAMQLVAVCFTLASDALGTQALQTLLLLSLYLQWIGLCCGAVLCWLRGFFEVARPQVVFLVCWASMVVIVMLLADIAWAIGSSGAFGPVLPADEPRLYFVLRHAIIAAVVSMLLLRYFWSRHQWREQVRAEGESRYRALSANIRPHFFFNALNSLAALIAVRPLEAERMVEDMADVFRASLEKRGQLTPLMEEMAACDAYLRIEQIRLGDRLRSEWQVPEALRSWPTPALVLQPLIENAVYHGISRVREGGLLRVTAREEEGLLVVEVSNPLPRSEEALKGHVGGNGIAIANIASRMSLLYGERGSLELGPDEDCFKARLRIPAQANAQGESE